MHWQTQSDQDPHETQTSNDSTTEGLTHMSSTASTDFEPIVRRSIINDFNAWLNNPTSHLIVHGACGSGKTLLVNWLVERADMEVLLSSSADKRDKDELKRMTGIARSPSFFGKARVLFIDDADTIKSFKALSMPCPFPLIFATHSVGDLPWDIRQGARQIALDPPTPAQMQRWMDERTDGFSQTDKERIMSQSSSWRQLQFNARMTPPGRAPMKQDEVLVKLPQAQQPTAILGGNLRGPSTVSLLRIIDTAEYNHAPTETVQQAQWLASRTWHAPGLAKIARQYAERLRSRYRKVERPPFRKRTT